MRIGICAYWFNRGQGVVARHIRSALDELGHETFVLARPTRATNIRAAFVDRGDVWDQPGITEASAYEIPTREYLDWARDNELDVAMFDQNYGFEGIAALRRAGVRTVGRFVWEQFGPDHVAPAKDALEVVYSLTDCEQRRYLGFGIESPRVPWGIHPELLAHAPDRKTQAATDPPARGREAEHGGGGGSGGREAEHAGGGDSVVFFYPGGFLSKRKPLAEVLKAFGKVRDERLRLVVKAQVERRVELLERASERDARVEVVLDDLPTEQHLRRFAAADVCLAPSRWEGLGLHLFEATAFGMPVITNDAPPMNEVVTDGLNGLLVRSRARGTTRSGIPVCEPSVRGLRRAIREAADDSLRERLAAGARKQRRRLAWERTVDGYRRLLELVA